MNRHRPWRAAIVGAGPAGFYATGQLLAAGFEVDLLDELPTPHGLVRAGVAPDHPKIKAVTRVFEKSAANPGFRFFGGVGLGRDVSPDELLERYHAVVYAFGTAEDRTLGIPGEELDGVVGASAFVGWYNGHPDRCATPVDLSGRHAVVVGNGNVAIDVARMLVLAPEELHRTDVADHALTALAGSAVRDVTIVGRRGPGEAAFTNPEVLELGELERADVHVDSADLQGAAAPDAHPTARRNVEILETYAQRPRGGAEHRIALRFFLSPTAVLGDGRAEAVRLVRNELIDGRAVPTGEEIELPCDLLVRSIGYRGVAVGGVPFDHARGTVPNAGGRVLADDGAVRAREYVAGWIKRGPSGVIGTNKKDAAETTAAVLADGEAGVLDADVLDADAAAAFLRERVPSLLGWDGWGRLDDHELRTGEERGRPRVKLVDVEEMQRVAGVGRAREAADALGV